MKLNREQRAKKIDRAIMLAWSSLSSHLTFTYRKYPIRKEGTKFHQKCVQEYAELIKILADLY